VRDRAPAPSKVKVSPFTFEVRYDKEAMEAAGANGACMEDLCTILLAPGNDWLVERETILHEALHAVWGQTYLDTKIPDDAADSEGEAIIRELAPRILALLRDNPQFVAYLTEK
jgi:hypothetical protein